MLISYRSSKEEQFYSCIKKLIQAHGERTARKIIQRINELDAANNALHLPKNARFHEHKGRRKGLYSLDLIHPFRLIVIPTCSFGSWQEIDSVQIYEVYNSHK